MANDDLHRDSTNVAALANGAPVIETSTLHARTDNAPIFLKLGGSLITDKRQVEAIRGDVLQRLATEIAAARCVQPGLRLVIGHGSGSFGHVHARRYGTRDGVYSAEEWLGYALTGDAAARLNRLVTGALLAVGAPAWSIQPGAIVHCRDGQIVQGLTEPIRRALDNGLIPIIFGDVVLDEVRGGTIASTEELFEWLAPDLAPKRIVLAGEVDGIYTADPQIDPTAQRIATITPQTLAEIQAGLGDSHGIDVTGGMRAKVAQSLRMAGQRTGVEVLICSGLVAGHVQQALLGASHRVGTRIYHE